MQHNNVIGKHQATDSFAKNAPPNFWLKDTEKTLLWIQILKILAISASIFFFLSTLRVGIALLVQTSGLSSRNRLLRGSVSLLFCFHHTSVQNTCQTSIFNQKHTFRTLFNHCLQWCQYFPVVIFLSFMTHGILSNLNQLIQMLCFNQERKIKGSETDETKSLKENPVFSF